MVASCRREASEEGARGHSVPFNSTFAEDMATGPCVSEEITGRATRAQTIEWVIRAWDGGIRSIRLPKKWLTEAGQSPILFTAPSHGELAQLGERMTGSHEVRGSIPLFSTRISEAATLVVAFVFDKGLWRNG